MTQISRVLVVDDSAFMRRAVERMLSPIPDVEIVGQATNGAEAVAAVAELRPDLVIMDVNMPEMDGLEALERIMSSYPTPVLLVSTLTSPGADVTLRGLELGAVDFLDKGSTGRSMDIYDLGPKLTEKVLAVLGSNLTPPPPVHAEPERRPAPPEIEERAPGTIDGFRVVAIGASTGGPRALSQVIPALPADLPAAVVVAQHMPEGFTETLAERLNRRSAMEVSEAHDGAFLRAGTVLVAPGRREMRIERRGGRLVTAVRLPEGGALNQPSANTLFESVAEMVGNAAVGVVLTGMGDDGATGLRMLREAGATTVAEAESTSVIFGMPKAAKPHADLVLPLPQVADALVRLCSVGTPSVQGDS